MEYAKDLSSGEIIAAEKASSSRFYVCPRPGCGGRVYRPNVSLQRAHFRHFPGKGTDECDEYYPSAGEGGIRLPRPIYDVEDNPTQLGVLLGQADGRWGLGLRLPEIPSEEMVEMSLEALRSAFVDVYTGHDRLLQVSALELRPGVGAARVDVVPSLQGYSTKPTGSWPKSVGTNVWKLKSRGLDARGTLFRLRRGEWTRVSAGAGAHHGEHLVLLADARCPPPDLVISERHDLISSDGMKWIVWEVHLPSEPIERVIHWLKRLNHKFIPRRWNLELATPPRSYSNQDDPVFWVGDTPILTLESPHPADATTLALQIGTNSYNVNIRTAQNRYAHVIVRMPGAGYARIIVDAGERSAKIDLTFIQPPTHASLYDLLAHTARLRIHIGQQSFEAWPMAKHKVNVLTSQLPEVRIEFGDETARAHVNVWRGGKLYSKRGLNAGGAKKEIEDTFASAECIEIDAGNLGQITLLPVHEAISTTHEAKSNQRLAWRDHVMSLCSGTDNSFTPSLIGQPRGLGSLALRQVAPGKLIRSRIALRKRLHI